MSEDFDEGATVAGWQAAQAAAIDDQNSLSNIAMVEGALDDDYFGSDFVGGYCLKRKSRKSPPPDLCWRWPSRLVATAAAFRLTSPKQKRLDTVAFKVANVRPIKMRRPRMVALCPENY